MSADTDFQEEQIVGENGDFSWYFQNSQDDQVTKMSAVMTFL